MEFLKKILYSINLASYWLLSYPVVSLGILIALFVCAVLNIGDVWAWRLTACILGYSACVIRYNRGD